MSIKEECSRCGKIISVPKYASSEKSYCVSCSLELVEYEISQGAEE